MPANPTIITNLFGEQFTAWTEEFAVYIASQLTEPQFAFNQPVEDGPISLTCDPAGLLTITYLDDEGNRLSQSSAHDGDTGTWS